MNNEIVIVWFRQDLRLSDNAALIAAHKSKRQILPIYILDDENSGEWKMGSASRWWLHESLIQLDKSLKGNLCLQKGDAHSILKGIIKKHDVKAVYWNRCYEPWCIKRDTYIKKSLSEKGIEVKSFNSALLFEPHTTLKKDGTPYKVFTPYYKKGCLENNADPALPKQTPKRLSFYECSSLTLDDLKLKPSIKWYKQIEKEWQPGEKGAEACLNQFLENGMNHYKEGRNFPSKNNVSRLSPYLHFGEISPNKVWHEAKMTMIENRCEKDGEHFLSELGWREFSNSLLYHFSDMPRENLQKKFNAFPWQEDDALLKCWQKGQTGYPIVDAGMRELWQTGYMHNRVRMIVGSFLVKNLLLHWHYGEDWFWDTLVDADLANNSASWQWIAGCGADAAPYFRIFNPITQGQKFDSDGNYVRKYVPELSKLPNKYLHAPWEASESILKEAEIELGKSYPEPIVELRASRERALAAFKSISGINSD